LIYKGSSDWPESQHAEFGEARRRQLARSAGSQPGLLRCPPRRTEALCQSGCGAKTFSPADSWLYSGRKPGCRSPQRMKRNSGGHWWYSMMSHSEGVSRRTLQRGGAVGIPNELIPRNPSVIPVPGPVEKALRGGLSSLGWVFKRRRPPSLKRSAGVSFKMQVSAELLVVREGSF